MYFYQPDSGAFGDLLLTELRQSEYKKYDSLVMLVAYAKYSGVARIADDLEAFTAADGAVDAVVGINQQQTTIEALELLAQVATRVRVFYDEDQNKTFHPKVYWLRHSESSDQWAAVGSNNLTAGGLYLNYEMSVVSTAKATTTDGNEVMLALNPIISGATKAGHLIDIDAASIKRLADEGYIVSEQEARAKSKAQRAARGASKSKAKIFVRSAPILLPTVPAKYLLPAPVTAPSAPGLPGGAAPSGAPTPGSPTVASPPAVSAGAPSTAAAVAGAATPTVAGAIGFWKRLTGSDVSLTSSPGQMIIPLDFLPHFPALSPLVTKPSGGRQADAFFAVEFREAGQPTLFVSDARLIRYEPAPTHPRQNVDLRFTFRDRRILNRLHVGDVLEFQPTGTHSPAMIVNLVPRSMVTRAGDYGTLP